MHLDRSLLVSSLLGAAASDLGRKEHDNPSIPFDFLHRHVLRSMKQHEEDCDKWH